jgi:hypothetical protein
MKNITKLNYQSHKTRTRVSLLLWCFMTVLFALPASAQIALRGSQTSTSTTTSVTIAKPTNLAVGDLMLANIVQSDSGDNQVLSNATASGWTLVAGREFGNVGNNSWWGTILYKVANATDVAATNFTFAGDADAEDTEGGIAAFSGVAVTGGVSGSPFDVAPGTINIANSDDFSATAITTATANAAVVMFGMIGDDRSIDPWTATSPATLTEIFDGPFNATLDMGMGMAWALKPVAGSTGTGAGELNRTENDPHGSLLIALRPCQSVGAASATPTLCADTALTNITHTTTGATGIGTATGLPSGVTASWASNTITISGTPTVSGTFNYSILVTGACGSVTATGTIIVNPKPTNVAATASPENICLGSSVNLTSSATSNSALNVVLIDEDFNALSNNWTPTNTSTVGTIANAAWTLRPNGHSVCATCSATELLNSNDSSQFYLSDSDSQGAGGNTRTTLQSPSFSTVGLNAASLTFYHYYRDYDGNDSAFVEISTNGTSWTTLNTYTTTQGTKAGFALVTVNLSSYLNQPSVAIRFRYAALYGYYWAIDNVVVSGTYSSMPAPTYAWTSLPAGFSSSVQNPTGIVPTQTTTYSVTATNSFGCTATTSTQVIVTPANTVSVASSTPTLCVNTALTNITHTTTSATGIGTAIGLPLGVTASWANNTITISGTPTTSGTFNYSIPLTGGCDSVSATGTIHVTPNVTINPFSAPTAIRCQGAETVTTTTSANNATGITYSLDATSISGGNSINATTGAVTYAASWSGNTTITATAAGCGGPVTTTHTITISPTTVGGIISGGGVRVCQGTTPADLTLSGYTGTIVRWEKSSNNTFTSPVTIASTSAVLAGSAIGVVSDTVYIRAVVQSGICNVAYSDVTTLTVVSTTWNGSTWSNGAPDSATTAFITGNYTANSNLFACNLTVSNNAVVLIPDGFHVTLSGALAVGTGSTFTLEPNANLVQTPSASSAVNTGKIRVKEVTPELKRQDYAMFSAPVSGQPLQAFSPSTLASRFYTYDPSTNIYVAVNTPAATNFTVGKGYLIRTPNNFPTTPTLWNATYEGTPFNGTLTIPVTTGTYNAVGNPYPSAIDADMFFDTNGLAEALYFYRKTNGTNTTAYATYTKTGGVSSSVLNGGNGSQDQSNTLEPDGTIAVGQGFVVKASSNAITFTNAMRINDEHGIQLRTTLERHRIWLNMSNPAGFFSQTLVAYMAGATNGVDAAIDGRYFNDSQTALTSIINSQEYAIQGRQLPFVASDVVALGFKTELSNTFTISLDKVDGLFLTSQVLYLRDKLTNIYTNLRTGSYTFSSVAGVFNNRFELRFATPPTFYQDADGDGFGSAFNTIQADIAPQGYVANPSECDDALATVNTNATEILSNGIDDNCDGTVDETTYATSYLTNASCGVTLTNLSNSLFAYNLATYVGQHGPVQGYRFEVSNGQTVRTYDSLNNQFNLLNLPGGATYGTTYSVRVSVKLAGFWRPYGSVCSVNTPAVPNTTSIVSPTCGSVLGDISNTIFCNPVTSASGYRFRVRLGDVLVGTYDSTVSRFSLTNLGLTNIAFGTTYSIDVLLKFGSTWRPDSEYGATCTISTPSAPPSSRIINPICGGTITNLWSTIFAHQVMGVQGYRFEVSTGGQAYVYDSPVSRFSLRNVVGLPLAPSTTYAIRVAVLYNAVYYDYGSECSVSTAAVVSRIAETDATAEIGALTEKQAVSETGFLPVPYPNPFVESFRISMSETTADVIHVLLYDFTGKLLDKNIIFSSDINTSQFGNQLPPGDYLLVVSQGAAIKSMHISKR